jgi:signal transduction histidine kinase
LRRLFTRIFLSVWLASALIGASIAVVEVVWRVPALARAEDHMVERLIAHEARVVLATPLAGRRAYVARLRDEAGVRLFVLGPDDRSRIEPETADPDIVIALARRIRAGDATPDRSGVETLSGVLLPSGDVAIARRARRPNWVRAIDVETLAPRTAIVLVVSALIALVLGRYLTRPLHDLRTATVRVAGGDLRARVGPAVADAPEEIAALARDFDRMVERVEALVTARDRLISDVSHELGSPLARLGVALELARERAGDAAAPMLDRIGVEADRLAALTREILALHRVETAGATAREPLDLRQLVGDVVRDAAFEAERTRVGVTVHAPDEAVVLRGDVELLRRAIENVVRNAIRHAPADSSVDVDLGADDSAVTVVIRDRGPGVPEADRERIFEPMVRLDRARQSDLGGAGLGLAIARRAVALHGGTIAADEAPDGGLRITIELPLHGPSPEVT